MQCSTMGMLILQLNNFFESQNIFVVVLSYMQSCTLSLCSLVCQQRWQRIIMKAQGSRLSIMFMQTPRSLAAFTSITGYVL